PCPHQSTRLHFVLSGSMRPQMELPVNSSAKILSIRRVLKGGCRYWYRCKISMGLHAPGTQQNQDDFSIGYNIQSLYLPVPGSSFLLSHPGWSPYLKKSHSRYPHGSVVPDYTGQSRSFRNLSSPFAPVLSIVFL